MRYFGFLGMLLTVFVLTNSSFSLAGGKPPSKGPYNFNDLVTLLHSFPDEQETLHPGTWPRALAPALRSSPDLPLRDIQSLLETFEKLCQEGHVTYRKGGDTVMIYVFEKEALYIRNYFRLQVIEIYLEHMQKRFESKKFSS